MDSSYRFYKYRIRKAGVQTFEHFQFSHSAFPGLGQRRNMLRRSSQPQIPAPPWGTQDITNCENFPTGPGSDPGSPSSETYLIHLFLEEPKAP